MKVNFNKPFVNSFGKEIHENGKVALMSEQVSAVLFSGRHLEANGEKASDEDKLKSYRLSLKIADAKEEVELTSEEAVMVKKAAGLLTAGAYGQIHDLIEG